MEIFKGEVEETLSRVQAALKNLLAFKTVYDEYRVKVKDYFNEGEPKEWEFAPQLVFHRFDQFVERVRLIKVGIYEFHCCRFKYG